MKRHLLDSSTTQSPPLVSNPLSNNPRKHRFQASWSSVPFAPLALNCVRYTMSSVRHLLSAVEGLRKDAGLAFRELLNWFDTPIVTSRRTMDADYRSGDLKVGLLPLSFDTVDAVSIRWMDIDSMFYVKDRQLICYHHHRHHLQILWFA